MSVRRFWPRGFEVRSLGFCGCWGWLGAEKAGFLRVGGGAGGGFIYFGNGVFWGMEVRRVRFQGGGCLEMVRVIVGVCVDDWFRWTNWEECYLMILG